MEENIHAKILSAPHEKERDRYKSWFFFRILGRMVSLFFFHRALYCANFEAGSTFDVVGSSSDLSLSLVFGLYFLCFCSFFFWPVRLPFFFLGWRRGFSGGVFSVMRG